MKKKSNGMPYAKFRPLIHRVKAHAERHGAELMPDGPEKSLQLFRIQLGQDSMDLTQAQLDLLEAEYVAAYGASRLHHVRQRNRMER